MSGKITADGLEELASSLLELGQKQFPKQTRNFMQKAGNKLKAVARRKYKADIGSGGKARYIEHGGKRKRTDLIGGLSRGRAYLYNGNEYQVRVKNTASHAHLFEHGHVATQAKRPEAQRFVKGRHTMGKAANQFSREYDEMADSFVDELLNSGLK